MNWRTELEGKVRRWTEAGLIDAEAAARLLAFEDREERRTALRWPVILAMVFGGILLAAGITLFVAAHWSELSPTARFSLMLLMVGVCHAGGAISAERFPVLSTTLHAIGTVTLGAAIFLTAQIFNLHEDWATGILLWAIGAAVGYALLRDWIQGSLLILLAPAWLISQWAISVDGHWGGMAPLAFGLILTAICYLSARGGDQESRLRQSMMAIGAVALLPCVGIAIGVALDEGHEFSYRRQSLSLSTLAVGWAIAVIAPLALAWILRRRDSWVNAAWAAWAYALVWSAEHFYLRSGRALEGQRSLGVTFVFYALLAIGSVGLVAWGLHDRRRERLNLGIAGFALSVLFFYFDNFMGKLDRSASLLLLGILCLLGGYALEVTRRKLTARMEASR